MNDTPTPRTIAAIDAPLDGPDGLNIAKRLVDECAKLEHENAALRAQTPLAEHVALVNRPNSELAALREENGKRKDQLAQIDGENAALRADKARLDWLDTQRNTVCTPDGNFIGYEVSIWSNNENNNIRAAIDAARKDAP